MASYKLCTLAACAFMCAFANEIVAGERTSQNDIEQGVRCAKLYAAVGQTKMSQLVAKYVSTSLHRDPLLKMTKKASEDIEAELINELNSAKKGFLENVTHREVAYYLIGLRGCDVYFMGGGMDALVETQR